MKALTILALLPLTAFANPVPSNGWTNLLEGEGGKLDHWQHDQNAKVTAAWTLTDGILHFHKSKEAGGNLLTKKDYFNFEMKFEWKISEKGNSGLKYRTTNALGYEFQVIDDTSGAAGKDSHRAGCLYDLVPGPDNKVLKPVGEWNSARIVANGKHLEHWLNGVKVIEIEISSDDWNERFAKSKYKKIKDFAAKPGPLLLQDHGNAVWFRNILVKEL